MFISCVSMGKAHWRGTFPICGAGVSYCLVRDPLFENAPTLPYPGALPYPKTGKNQVRSDCRLLWLSFIIDKPMVHLPCVCLHLLRHALYFLWMDFHPCLYVYIYTSLNPVPNAQVCVYLTVHITKLQLQTTFPKPLYI